MDYTLNEPLIQRYNKAPELSIKSIFNLRAEELQLFFRRNHVTLPENQGELRECLIILEKVGYNQGVMNKVCTDPENGIIGDKKDLTTRQSFFGENKFRLPVIDSYSKLLKEQFVDTNVQLLLLFATISLVCSFFSDVPYKYLESVSIYFAVFFAAAIASICDYSKSKQFVNLQTEIKNEKVCVLRGQSGVTTQIYVRDLVVGDIIVLEAGDRVPADCLLVQEMDMFVDQSMYFNGETNVEKQASNGQNHQQNPDPVLLTGSLIMAGAGKAVVLAVGEKTLHEVENEGKQLNFGEEFTPIQIRLQKLAVVISKYAYIFAALCLTVSTIFLIFNIMFGQDSEGTGISLISTDSLLDFLENMQIAVALIIVSVPEGLPLAISLALAFSIDRLMKDNLLIADLEALENSGCLTDVCTGKTCTLTEGNMTIGTLYTGCAEQETHGQQLNHTLQEILNRCIILNTEARMEIDDKEHIYVPQGNAVEVGLLKYLIINDLAAHELLAQREQEDRLKLLIPFSPIRKRMTVAYQGQDGNVRLVVKGAPEYVIPMCVQQLDSNGMEAGFDGQDLLDNKIQEIGQRGQKPIVMCYRDFSAEEFDQLMSDYNGFQDEESRQYIESQLTFLAAFGMNDELREGVKGSIEALEQARTNTKMLTGDFRETAIFVAHEAGIINKEDDSTTEDAILSAEEFRSRCESLVNESFNDGRRVWNFNSIDALKQFKDQIVEKVKIVYRCNPEDKHMFVALMKQQGSNIAVIADGINDVLALEEAMVGFAMGENGCAVARDASQIILTDDNFVSLFNSIKWGRNMMDNCRKFIQFQMTVNMSCLFIVILGSATLGRPPFSIIQLLWINLVMDVLAALALATEAPHPTELKANNVDESAPIILPVMWRSIYSQVIYQCLVMTIMLYLAPVMGGYSYHLVQSPLRDEDGATDRTLHYTFMFQTFVMMNLFNLVNCRKLSGEVDKEFNIFQNIHHNWWFLIILLVELNIQFFMIGYSSVGIIFQTTPLYFSQQLTAFFLGLGSWIVAAAVKATPFEWTDRFPKVAEDEQDENDIGSKIFSQVQQAQKSIE